ncbi:hypothetical protein V6N12_054715 [Hibiscus sabdariffa]|uniref:RNase H type-1 domain-containing protein n=1 Tax=Hibiscus sabdariffa TaxID=183260 RepID=A0ABR2D1B0_9ROSI
MAPSYFPTQAEDCDLLFGSILWNTWLRHNQHIFNPDGSTHESLISQSYRMRDEARSDMSLRSIPCCVSPAGYIIRNWCKPLVGWIKVNTDEARDPNSGVTFCGGVGRDSNMEWCFGFSKKFDGRPERIHSPLRSPIVPLLSKNWKVAFKWVNRQYNSMADKLAKMAKDLPLPYYRFMDPLLMFLIYSMVMLVPALLVSLVSLFGLDDVVLL